MFRRSPRVLVLWAGALVVAVVTAGVVAGDLASIHRRATALGPEDAAVVAARDLPAGTVLERDDLRTRPVHRSQLPPGALTDLATARARTVTVPVLRGGFVAAGNLAPRRRTGLDGIVPAGMRAIRVDVAGALVPRVGASVDVLASYPGDATGAAATVVVAAGALVLATDRNGTEGTGRSGAGVTLLVDAVEAGDLAGAQANGVLALALVPPEEGGGALLGRARERNRADREVGGAASSAR
jgi:Flp pilus assembly protein CpaB